MNKVIFYTVTGIVILGILTSCRNKDHVQKQAKLKPLIQTLLKISKQKITTRLKLAFL
ncbi:hypothetical protein PbDSM24746_03410 [Paenibacillus macerans]|nr:hypothetical protein PbDSM24746_03410 [Paenibacillus macerans]GBK66635.1 hypothetical protein PbJCM17693_03430 [Paenibacillus macerans]